MSVLANKAVLSSLNISEWTARKLDRKVTAETNQRYKAADNAGWYNKLLIDDETLDEIHSIVSEARNLHAKQTQPWIDKGPRVLSNKLIAKHTADFQILRQRFETAADAFSDKYPRLLRDAPKRLNGMFDRDDFPDPDKVRGMFKMKLDLMPCPDEGDFRVSIGEEQLADFRESMDDAHKRQQQDTKERLTAIIGNMATRLREYGKVDDGEESSDGRQKGKRAGAFRDSLVGNVRELAELADAFNLDDDPKLTKIIEDVQASLCAHEPDELREDAKLRARTAKSADKILRDVSTFFA